MKKGVSSKTPKKITRKTTDPNKRVLVNLIETALKALEAAVDGAEDDVTQLGIAVQFVQLSFPEFEAGANKLHHGDDKAAD